MKLILLILLSTLLFLFSTSTASAQIVINEFSSNSDPEWVEFYNTTSSPIDLTNWKIQDEAQAPKILSGSIPAQGFLIFENPSGWLNNSGGDTITLKDASDITINSVHYGSGGVVSIPDSDKSAGRVPNASENWQNNLIWTKGLSNPDPTPTPSSTSTPTTAPTNAPTTTSTASPTKTPTPAPTKTTTPKPTKTPTPEATESAEPAVLGVTSEPSPDPTAIVEENTVKKSLPYLPIIFIGSGVLMIGFAVYNLFRAKSSPVQN